METKSKMNIVFIGSQSIGHDCLQEIINLGINVQAVFTFLPEKHEIWLKSVNELAKNNQIPIYFHNELKPEKISELQPDLLIVIGYRKIFSQEILGIPKYGVIGLHASLLPKFRGFAPLNWAIINDEKETGVTMFLMNEDMDTGDIIAQKKIGIDVNDTITILKKKIGLLSVELIKENIPKILRGEIKRIKQSTENISYGCARIPEDSKIDWNDNSEKIYNLIRASEDSYPAFTFLKGKKILIKKADIVNHTYFGTAGQIARILNDGSVYIKTGNGCLKISEIFFEDGTKMTSNQVLNSLKLRLSF